MLLGLRRQRILIGALTEKHLKSLELGDRLEGTFILPMAASNAFFDVGRNRAQEISRDIPVVGYIGKATSSGNENGLISFLSSIRIAQDRDLNVKFWFAGIEDFHATKLRQMARETGIFDDFLKITGHVNHERVPDILAKFDFGLMPYIESAYNSYRFPIKSVEYAAAQLPILATNTASHQQILNSSIAVFYDQVNPHDFVVQLDCLLKHKESVLNLKESAAVWASNFTYYNRVRQASQALQKLRTLES
jgi:glycosyltransferase involved in cell wall biosynthesis